MKKLILLPLLALAIGLAAPTTVFAANGVNQTDMMTGETNANISFTPGDKKPEGDIDVKPPYVDNKPKNPIQGGYGNTYSGTIQATGYNKNLNLSFVGIAILAMIALFLVIKRGKELSDETKDEEI